MLLLHQALHMPGHCMEKVGHGSEKSHLLHFGRNILGSLGWRYLCCLKHPCIHLWSCHRNTTVLEPASTWGPKLGIEVKQLEGLAISRTLVTCAVLRGQGAGKRDPVLQAQHT